MRPDEIWSYPIDWNWVDNGKGYLVFCFIAKDGNLIPKFDGFKKVSIPKGSKKWQIAKQLTNACYVDSTLEEALPFYLIVGKTKTTVVKDEVAGRFLWKSDVSRDVIKNDILCEEEVLQSVMAIEVIKED